MQSVIEAHGVHIAAAGELLRRNLDVLREQLDLTRNREVTGNVTFTDVAEVQSRLAAVKSEMARCAGRL
jgi:outer membrane protein TolC